MALILNIVAEENFDLTRIVDELLDGALNEYAAVPEISVKRKRTALFGGADRQLSEINIEFKEEETDEFIAAVMAGVRKLVGNKAHVERIIKKSK